MFLFCRITNHAFEFGLVLFVFCSYEKDKRLITLMSKFPDLPRATEAPKKRSVTFMDSPIRAEPEAEMEGEIAEFKMNLMGTSSSDAVTGLPVHTLIEKTWSAIFTKGFSKESKEVLLKKYPAPQNLQLARAPILNTEVRQEISLASAKRDDYQFSTQ